jgi:hypothetical protein
LAQHALPSQSLGWAWASQGQTIHPELAESGLFLCLFKNFLFNLTMLSFFNWHYIPSLYFSPFTCNQVSFFTSMIIQ